MRVVFPQHFVLRYDEDVETRQHLGTPSQQAHHVLVVNIAKVYFA